ncbi:hypothetical protein KIW84_014790 [Lathyrus oleraceus]|uniref:Uncharacterized protein n=1 Tax=Pisum sativum TaxID=3888 RepID=A0A9D5BNJ7_PEA|nr:hypothetical protein KIW84_014790 [Pisum sativum]
MRHNHIPVILSSINEKLTKTQRAHIECTPFKWAMDISNNFSISGGLLCELVSRWDVRSRGFRVRDRIVPFTSVDVSFALGLSIVGKSLVVEEDQQYQTLDLFKGAEVILNNIRKQLRCHKKKIVNFVRLYILLAFTEFYFPKTGNKVFMGFIKQLDDLDFLDAHSWVIVVYNFVVSRLVAENKDFKEMIVVLEYEVRMMKEARVNTPFEDEVVQDDR